MRVCVACVLKFNICQKNDKPVAASTRYKATVAISAAETTK